MTNRRLLSSDLYEDEFIGSLDIFHRYMWIGLITACADDQGRFLANASVIRAKIFPFDDYRITDIEAALQVFSDAGKLLIYHSNGKRLAQIVAWWKHQAPSWASPSKYPPPAGWVDRHKYHVVGNKVIMLNWDTPGGLPTSVPTQLPTGINESEGEDESEILEEEGAPPEQTRPNIFKVYEDNIGSLTTLITEKLLQIERDYPEAWFVEAVKIASEHNVRNLSYIQAILKRWQAEGFKSDSRVKRQPRPNGKKTVQEDMDALAQWVAQKEEEAASVNA